MMKTYRLRFGWLMLRCRLLDHREPMQRHPVHHHLLRHPNVVWDALVSFATFCYFDAKWWLIFKFKTNNRKTQSNGRRTWWCPDGGSMLFDFLFINWWWRTLLMKHTHTTAPSFFWISNPIMNKGWNCKKKIDEKKHSVSCLNVLFSSNRTVFHIVPCPHEWLDYSFHWCRTLITNQADDFELAMIELWPGHKFRLSKKNFFKSPLFIWCWTITKNTRLRWTQKQHNERTNVEIKKKQISTSKKWKSYNNNTAVVVFRCLFGVWIQREMMKNKSAHPPEFLDALPMEAGRVVLWRVAVRTSFFLSFSPPRPPSPPTSWFYPPLASLLRLWHYYSQCDGTRIERREREKEKKEGGGKERGGAGAPQFSPFYTIRTTSSTLYRR